MAVRVQQVEKGSAAERLGIRPGSVLLSADGNELNDMLDYQFYTSGASFQLAVSTEGHLDYLQVDKTEYEPLGCGFETYLFPILSFILFEKSTIKSTLEVRLKSSGLNLFFVSGDVTSSTLYL